MTALVLGTPIGYKRGVSLANRFKIPLWREGRAALEHAALQRDPVLRGEHLARGDGRPVMLIPGFMAGDLSLGLMARWLRDIGYRPTRAGIRANVDCTERALGRLERQLERANERHGRKVSIVGHSRGGTMARVLAVRRPELIEQLICLGSPLADQFEVHPFVRAQVRAVALLGSLGVPGLFTYGCGSGCCVQATHDITAPFPAGVGFTSIYSRSDGVVAWRTCLDPAADHVEIPSSHIGMAVNAHVFRAIAQTLAEESQAGAGGRSIAVAA